MRLTLKELREILRDRRTIVTLVLMPLLLYPLLAISFQQFFMSQLGRVETPRYRLGFRDPEEAHYLAKVLRLGGLTVVDVVDSDEPPPGEQEGKPIVEAGVRPELDLGLEEFDIDVGLRLDDQRPQPLSAAGDVGLNVELLYRDDVLQSRDAADYIEKHLRTASERLLAARLEAMQVSQRPVPIMTRRRAMAMTEGGGGGTVSITSIVPFVLILMTITGAVYPAIDLTAGERERGTLEVLVAAPIPRIGVLFAKYVAVLTVALLTAAANLLTMTITITATGLGGLLFGEEGVSTGVIAAVFGLLLLFSAFFSAVLLVFTSCARSFKEAQAYLIPLTLFALAPGMLSLMPGLELSGLLLVTPLANIVLLGRDLFALRATEGAALTVVVSTLAYAAAAIGVAARVFGSESVLYSSQSGWADLFRRPRHRQPAPTLTAATTCLALMFPAYFLLINLLGDLANIRQKLLAGSVITLVIFGLLPWIACWFRRVDIRRTFGWPRNGVPVFVGALCLGLSIWVLAHDLVAFSQHMRGIRLTTEYLAAVQRFAAELRILPIGLVLLAMSVIPALFEEGFFRGYLFAAMHRITSGWTAVLVTSAAFGLFHAIVPNPLFSERLISSTLVGLVLGWVRWRTGSVLPGMLLHLCHNGLLMLVAYYQTDLEARGIGVGEGIYLPTGWMIASVVGTVLGLVLVGAFGRGHRKAE